MDWVQITQIAANVATVFTLVVAIYAYVFTVRPVFDKEQLEAESNRLRNENGRLKAIYEQLQMQELHLQFQSAVSAYALNDARSFAANPPAPNDTPLTIAERAEKEWPDVHSISEGLLHPLRDLYPQAVVARYAESLEHTMSTFSCTRPDFMQRGHLDLDDFRQKLDAWKESLGRARDQSPGSMTEGQVERGREAYIRMALMKTSVELQAARAACLDQLAELVGKMPLPSVEDRPI